METLNYSFQSDSKVVNDVYSQHPNYLIESYKNESKVIKPCCIIYFSSHDIYYPNKSDIFFKEIVEKNRFEWYNQRIKIGAKHIFLRDIKKQWYLNGINKNLDSIEKLLDFLKTETKGFDVITIGSSAGGFASVLFGILLDAIRIYSFNGRFCFDNLLKVMTEKKHPIVFREKDNPNINKYFNIKNLITKPKVIFYFYSINSEKDKYQFNCVEDSGINIIHFKTKHHGIPFLKSNLKFVINFNEMELMNFVGKIYHPILFSIKIEGLKNTIYSIIYQIFKATIRKFK